MAAADAVSHVFVFLMCAAFTESQHDHLDAVTPVELLLLFSKTL